MRMLKTSLQDKYMFDLVEYLKENDAVAGFQLDVSDIYIPVYGQLPYSTGLEIAFSELVREGMLIEKRGSYQLTEKGEEWLREAEGKR